jgi:hypothetical protein
MSRIVAQPVNATTILKLVSMDDDENGRVDGLLFYKDLKYNLTGNFLSYENITSKLNRLST